MMFVTQPPPSAKCGNTAVVDVAASRSTTGSVVIRKSERSFTTPRKATTASPFEELNVNEPENDEGPKNGFSVKNAATCSLAPMVVEFEKTSLPLSSVKLKETTAGSEFGLAI